MINNFPLKRIHGDISTFREGELKTSFEIDLGRQRENQIDEKYEAY
jgi:hypothetical protein